MLRINTTAVETNLQINIPKEYVGKNLEVLVFETNEGFQKTPIVKVDFSKFRKIFDKNESKKISKHLTKIRSEWEHNN